MGHGIHQMDLLGAVLGPWTEISAIARQQVRLTATEDMSMAHITFANGAVASVVNSVLSPREETYLRFDFERATVELTHLYGYGEEDWRVTAIPSCEEKVMAAWRDGSAEVRSGHHAQLEAVFSALRCGAPPPVTAIEAKNTMQMVAGVYASAFGHAPVCPEDLRPDSPYFDRMDGGGATWAI
jgi:predicted dehydrogenase